MDKKNEKYKIYGFMYEIFDKASVRFDELQSLFDYYLQLQPISELLYEVMRQDLKIPAYGRNLVKVQDVYKTFNHQNFMPDNQQLINGRSLEENEKIMRSALQLFGRSLLSLKDIKYSVCVFQLKEDESLYSGIPIDFEMIQNILDKFDKTIHREVFNEWINLNQDFLEQKDRLRCYEFIYLIPNTICKSKTDQKIKHPTYVFSKKSQVLQNYFKNLIYELEHEKLKYFKTPQDRMQHHIFYDFNKDYFDFLGKTKHQCQKDKNKKKDSKDSQINDKFELFKKDLFNQEQKNELKETIKNVNTLLDQIKLNGKDVKKNMIQEIQNGQAIIEKEDEIQKSNEFIMSDEEIKPILQIQKSESTKSQRFINFKQGYSQYNDGIFKKKKIQNQNLYDTKISYFQQQQMDNYKSKKSKNIFQQQFKRYNSQEKHLNMQQELLQKQNFQIKNKKTNATKFAKDIKKSLNLNEIQNQKLIQKSDRMSSRFQSAKFQTYNINQFNKTTDQSSQSSQEKLEKSNSLIPNQNRILTTSSIRPSINLESAINNSQTNSYKYNIMFTQKSCREL